MIATRLVVAAVLTAVAGPAFAADRCGAPPAPPALPNAAAADPDMTAFQSATVDAEAYATEAETYRNCLAASGATDAQERIDASKDDEARARQDFENWQSAYASAHSGQ